VLGACCVMLDCLLLSWSFEFETTKTSMCCTVMLAATIMIPLLLLV